MFRYGVITSGPQFIYWLLDTVCRAINLRTAALTWSHYDADVGMIDDVINVQFTSTDIQSHYIVRIQAPHQIKILLNTITVNFP